jgi:hypothetical protein
MTALYEQPLRKLLGSLSITINWMIERGNVEVNTVPAEHIEAVKQLERIGIVHKRNNKIYELQKVRLKKLMDSMGMDTLPVTVAKPSVAPAPVAPVAPVVGPSTTPATPPEAPVASVVIDTPSAG